MIHTIKDPLYSKAQTCGYISIDDRTLDRWVATNKFPKPDLYLGRNPRWKLSTINAYLDQKKREYQQLIERRKKRHPAYAFLNGEVINPYNEQQNEEHQENDR